MLCFLLVERSDVVLFCWRSDQMLCCFVGGAIKCFVLLVEQSDVVFFVGGAIRCCVYFVGGAIRCCVPPAATM